MEKMKMESMDIIQKNIEKLGEIFPGCITEELDENGKLCKQVNFEVLEELLSKNRGGSNTQERYEFSWVGKSKARLEATTPIRKTLRPCIEESKDWDNTENLYIEGDNLEALKLLQESYLNKVKMIYIDPPYNTGNDFIYKDNFAQDIDEYEEAKETFDENGNRLFKNTDTNGRFHSDWCSMIYSRLLLARNLLADDGVIFISIDDNEQENLKKICDEVFGAKNFICNFVWKSKLGKVGTGTKISILHEYIICYAKKINLTKIKMIENKSQGRKENLRQWGVADRREDRPSMFYPIIIEGKEILPIKDDGTEGRWRVGEDTAKKLLEDGYLELANKNGKYNIYRIFPDNISYIPFGSLILDEIGTTAKGARILKDLNMTNVFSFSKPIELIDYFINLLIEKDSIILDFFSGSATTAHAVMQLNAEDGGKRKFIMVQLPEKTDEKSEAFKAGYKNICEIGKERIRRAGEKIKEEAGLNGQNLDIGFRVLKIDDSNMKDVYYNPLEYNQDMLLQMNSNIKEDRTDLDLLFGCLLDWGVELNKPYVVENINEHKVHTYNDGDLVACFEENLDKETLKIIAKKNPLRAVFSDRCFADSEQKINMGELFKMLAPDTEVKVI